MKKICIIILNLQIMVWMSGCMVQETESEMILQKEQGPFIVHISSAVEPEPIETPVHTEVDWEDIIELSEEMLPDEESLKELLSEPVRILDFVQGDIGEDGKDEIVIIYEYPEIADSNCFLRKVAVFTAEESFTCAAFHETLIPDSLSGGMMGDPYVGTYIQNGDLGFFIYGGSAWRWSYDIWFSMEENQLILSKLIDTSSHIHSGDHIYMTYDYERQQTICEAGWYADEFHREELYRYDWDEEVDVPMFQEVHDMFGDEDIPSIDIPLAISDLFYSSYQLREQEVDFSASEILDKVKEMYYPSMERIDHRTKGINFENISSYLGYQVPEYHYEDRDGLQLYYRTARYDEEFGWNHEIGIQSRNGGVYDEIFYEEEDTWCEEQLRLLAQNEQIVEHGIFVGENGGQYTVTDWNHNGRLEIIFSYNTGSGRYSNNSFFEVNEELDGVIALTSTYDWTDSEVDITLQTYSECYYDEENSIYYYVFEDYLRDGINLSYESKCALYLEGESVKTIPLAFRTTHYDQENGTQNIVCIDADRESVISEEAYHNAASDYFGDMHMEDVLICWFDAESTFSKSEDMIYTYLKSCFA